MEVDMFIPEIDLARHLLKARLREAEQQRLIRTAELAAKSGRPTRSSRVLAGLGDRLIAMGSYLQLKACDSCPKTPGYTDGCLVQA
jgi:hypothetical protein